ncbi:hypothetical protein BGX28_000641 [Mortierella sp. GBA30]|nr:hypothetical protein BGX28_000641 [Mortierella sp. GBA30]
MPASQSAAPSKGKGLEKKEAKSQPSQGSAEVDASTDAPGAMDEDPSHPSSSSSPPSPHSPAVQEPPQKSEPTKDPVTVMSWAQVASSANYRPLHTTTLPPPLTHVNGPTLVYPRDQNTSVTRMLGGVSKALRGIADTVNWDSRGYVVASFFSETERQSAAKTEVRIGSTIYTPHEGVYYARNKETITIVDAPYHRSQEELQAELDRLFCHLGTVGDIRYQFHEDTDVKTGKVMFTLTLHDTDNENPMLIRTGPLFNQPTLFTWATGGPVCMHCARVGHVRSTCTEIRTAQYQIAGVPHLSHSPRVVPTNGNTAQPGTQHPTTASKANHDNKTASKTTMKTANKTAAGTGVSAAAPTKSVKNKKGNKTGAPVIDTEGFQLVQSTQRPRATSPTAKTSASKQTGKAGGQHSPQKIFSPLKSSASPQKNKSEGEQQVEPFVFPTTGPNVVFTSTEFDKDMVMPSGIFIETPKSALPPRKRRNSEKRESARKSTTAPSPISSKDLAGSKDIPNPKANQTAKKEGKIGEKAPNSTDDTMLADLVREEEQATDDLLGPAGPDVSMSDVDRNE